MVGTSALFWPPSIIRMDKFGSAAASREATTQAVVPPVKTVNKSGSPSIVWRTLVLATDDDDIHLLDIIGKFVVEAHDENCVQWLRVESRTGNSATVCLKDAGKDISSTTSWETGLLFHKGPASNIQTIERCLLQAPPEPAPAHAERLQCSCMHQAMMCGIQSEVGNLGTHSAARRTSL
jgi:hypothetical protein